MNWKTWVPLVLAIVLGVVAAKVARDTIMKNRAPVAAAGKFTKIAVVKTDVAPGRALATEDITLAQVETENIPAGSFKTAEELVGRVSETLMVKNQPILEAMLAPTGTGSGFQVLIPPGQRAITIEVNEFSGVAGLLTPGCRVDIIATLNDNTSGGTGQLSRTIVQNVKVSAVGQKTMATGTGNEPPPPPGTEMFKSVTVLVTPQDAESIELACATGRPRLVLRGGRDNATVTTAGMTIGELKGAIVAAAAPTPTTQPAVAVAPTTQPTAEVIVKQTPSRVVKVIRGGVVSNVTIKLPSEPAEDATAKTPQEALDPFDGN